MSSHSTPAPPCLEAEFQIDNDDERTLPQEGETDREPHSDGDDRRMSQETQLIPLLDGREPQRWISERGRIHYTRQDPDETDSEMEWSDYIQEDPDRPHLRNRPPSSVSIFRVPKFLKDTKREAYVPQRVSLGPYHHGSAELRAMGHHKGRSLRRLITRFNANSNRPVVPNSMDFADRARAEILLLEREIRDSYDEDIAYNRETLARMLCLDGCFLLEVLTTLAVKNLSVAGAVDCYDPIFGKNKLDYAAKDVLEDILMLENQIPFIVLVKLIELELNSTVDPNMLLDLLMKVAFLCFNPFDNKDIDIEQLPRPHHLLGFLHAAIAFLPSARLGERVDQGTCSSSIDYCSWQCIRMLQGRSRAPNNTKRIPHAVELRNAGIKFSPLRQGGIEQIKFNENSATIFLPPISITDRTEIVFRNLIAYEMCKPFRRNYVSCYMALMNDLIDTEQDVALMRRMGLMSNWLGSDKEVADLFNGLGKKVTVNEKYVFDNLTEKVNAHYNNEVKVQIGNCVQDHCSSPWKACALITASVILVLTVLQTIFTIISTYKK